jgi:hypothetical protein
MINLFKNSNYDRATLKKNIYAVKLIDILKTQKNLDVTFIVRYILNKKYQITEDDHISIPTILKYQPQITYDEIFNAMLSYDSDDDSVEDFETVANIK